jgi:hypothetical protein
MPNATINNPVDYVMDNSTDRITMSVQSNWNAGYSASFKTMPTLLNSLALLWADLDKDRYTDWANVPIQAAECALYLCVKEFNTTIQGGQVKEFSQEVSWTRAPNSYQLVNAPQNNTNTTLIQNLLDTNLATTQRTDLQLLSPSRYLPKGPFNISQAGIGGLVYYIDRAFDDRTLWYEGPSEDGKTLTQAQVRAGVSGVVRLVPITNEYQFTPEVMEVLWNNRTALPVLFQNLAASITNHIRLTADGGEVLEGDYGSHLAVFRIRWVWIVLITLTQVFAMVFLYLTIRATMKTKTPLWKSSLLSVLFHGLSVRLKRTGIKQVVQSEMSEEAKGIVAKLELIDEHGGICLGKSNFYEFYFWKG